MIPDGWTASRMREFGEFFGGSTPSTTDPSLWGGEIRFLVPSDISQMQDYHTHLYETSSRLSKKGYESCSTHLLPVGTVVISSRATIGDCIIIGREMCTNQGFISTVCNGRMNELFLLYWLRQNKCYVQRFAAGTTFDEIGRRTFKNLLVIHPIDKDEQEVIAASIAHLDSAIAAQHDAVAKAERLQRGLMQQLLSGRLKPDGTPRMPDEMKDTKLGLLPKTWTVARMKDFGEVSTGKTPPTDNEANFGTDFQFITPGDLGMTKWIWQTERSLSTLGAEFAGMLPANAVCVVCIGATIGKVGLTVRSACTNQQINSVVCHEGHSPEYLYYTVRQRARHLQVIAGVNATPQLNKTDFSKHRIPMPATPEEEAQIGKRLAVFDDLVEAKKQKIVALQRLKKSLMQNLLTGRIRLPFECTEQKGGHPHE